MALLSARYLIKRTLFAVRDKTLDRTLVTQTPHKPVYGASAGSAAALIRKRRNDFIG